MYICVCTVSQGQVRRTELVATIEVPKWDIHEWRKQRDVLIAGQILEEILEHMESLLCRHHDSAVNTVSYQIDNRYMTVSPRETL